MQHTLSARNGLRARSEESSCVGSGVPPTSIVEKTVAGRSCTITPTPPLKSRICSVGCKLRQGRRQGNPPAIFDSRCFAAARVPSASPSKGGGQDTIPVPKTSTRTRLCLGRYLLHDVQVDEFRGTFQHLRHHR